MDSSDQRRKRKRILLRQSSYSLLHLLSVRSLLICFSFLSFLCLLSYSGPFTSSSFHPILSVPKLSILSSSSSRTVKSVQLFNNFLSPLKIETRVLFPDHVLLLVRGCKKNEELECVYYGKNGGIRYKNRVFDVKTAISVDEYDGFRLIVRCPLSPSLDSSVNLRRRGKKNRIFGGLKNQTVNSWENVAYAAVVDGETAVVFVKGLNLRPDRDSDPSPFTCHFALGKMNGNDRYTLTTKALTAAQEVVRCSLPKIISKNLDKVQGVPITVGFTRHRAHEPILVPSMAKIFNPGPKVGHSGGKHGLCVCTMVWNQASAIREWIAYHSWLGVERWFIYDNNSDDGIDKVIHDLEDYNVTRHVWPWIKTQEAGFSHCALRAKEECEWVSFMDVDEYFYLPYSDTKHNDFRPLGFAGQNSLRALVGNSSADIGEIRTSCHSFGPSGQGSRPSRGVMVGYTCRLQSPERHKSIVRPDALDHTLLNVVHHFHLREGFEYVNLPMSTAMINHYKYQVWEVFRAKFYRRVATYVADWRENQNEGSRDRAPGLGTEAIEPPDWSTRFCEVWDTGLRDFVLSNLTDISTGSLPWERDF